MKAYIETKFPISIRYIFKNFNEASMQRKNFENVLKPF